MKRKALSTALALLIIIGGISNVPVVFAEDLPDIQIEEIADCTYTGGEITPEIAVKYKGEPLESGKYTAEYKNNINAGVATVTVTGNEDHPGTQTADFNILPVSINTARVSGIVNKAYSSGAVTQSLYVSVFGKTLKYKTDFTVSYYGNVAAGYTPVTITGTGNYTGKITKYFYITLGKTAVSYIKSTTKTPATLKWNAVAGATGYEVFMARGKGGKYSRVYVGKSTVYNSYCLAKNKVYYFKVRAYATKNGKTMYSEFSTAKKLTAKCGGLAFKASQNSIKLGKSAKLLAVYNGKQISGVAYKTANAAVATVTSGATVTAKGHGSTYIYATYKGSTAVTKVTVLVSSKSVKINKIAKNLKIDSSTNLKATLTPTYSTDSIKWSSSDKSVISVSKSGKITGKSSGTATITAKTASGKTAKVKIKVINFRMKSNSVKVNLGKSYTLTAKSGKIKSWTSSNKKIATVKNGKIHGVNYGKCTVTATDSNGLKCYVKVTVKKPYVPKLKFKVKCKAQSTYCYAFNLQNKGPVDIKIYADGASIYTPETGTKRSNILMVDTKKLTSTKKLKFIKSATIKPKAGYVVEYFWNKETFVSNKTTATFKAKYDGEMYWITVGKSGVTSKRIEK